MSSLLESHPTALAIICVVSASVMIVYLLGTYYFVPLWVEQAKIRDEQWASAEPYVIHKSEKIDDDGINPVDIVMKGRADDDNFWRAIAKMQEPPAAYSTAGKNPTVTGNGTAYIILYQG